MFPLATIEALELLSKFHMANILRYVVAQGSPYLVATVGRLCHISSDLADFTIIKSELNELRWRVLSLEKEKRKFEESYDFLDGEKAYVEEHVVSLDIKVERLSQQVEGLE